MVKAMWNDVVVAETGKTEIVEGNHYFPPESINRQYFQKSDRHTTCHWKGVASYYDVVVDGEKVQNAAWYYPDPKPAASNIKDHVAFYGMIKIIE
ncbi:MAG: DUF427 domain-containing protein [Chloroflexota bacterium]|jgi:uncharacterized protein (DUF427 family)